MKNFIPFSKHSKLGNDLKYVKKVIENNQTCGDGPFSKKVEELLSKKLKISGKSLLTTSCTHALEMSAILIDIKSGDEVIVPSFTFVSTALAFHMRGARIIFADIRFDTLNIDEKKIESLITNKTKAIVVVHYAGVSCEMKDIMRIGKKYKLKIIEDNAHGLFGEYHGKKLGTIGDISTFSFHETKNISCGEGGAIVLNKSNLLKRAEIIREKGTNRLNFIRGKLNKYRWVDKGSSYILSEILSAVLFYQLKNSRKIQLKRKKLWEKYHKNLKNWCDKNNVIQPSIPYYCKQPYHMYFLLFPNKNIRTKFRNHLSKFNIVASPHYQPLHTSPYAKKFSKPKNDTCPIATNISKRILRLPFFYDITEKQTLKVIDAIKSFQC